MSWCRISEIGKAATLTTLEAVDGILCDYGLVFYRAEDSWYAPSPVYTPVGANQWKVDSGRFVISLKSVLSYPNQRLSVSPSSSLDWHSEELTFGDIDGRNVMITSQDTHPLRFNGETGVISKKTLPVGTQLLPGDSVLRTDTVTGLVTQVIVGTEEASVLGDTLLDPPPALRFCAITVGRRIMTLSRDQNAKWDDGMNTLLDGWEDVLGKYT